jgi:hypothetical protein
MYWPPLVTETIAKHCLLLDENEPEWSISDVWSCILGEITGNALQIFINNVFIVVRGQKCTDMLPAPFGR